MGQFFDLQLLTYFLCVGFLINFRLLNIICKKDAYRKTILNISLETVNQLLENALL